MSAAKKETRSKAGHRARRRRQKMVAAAGAVLLVPGVVAAEPASLVGAASALDQAGVGLGASDPRDVGADGRLSDSERIGSQVLRDAGSPDLLAQDGLDLPSGPLGIPGIMLTAYKNAADKLAKSSPNCHLTWSLLASIGRIETNHARGGQVFTNGDTVHPILGPVLNGGGFATVPDSDRGRFDGDLTWDRAVGPMQFLPSTWLAYASDGNGDRVSSPHNVFDATLAAGKYLCSGGLDLANPQAVATAVFRYNHSDSYVRTVLIWADAYLKNVVPVPSTPVPTVPPLQQAIAPPVDPGTPGGTPPTGSSSTTTTTTTTTTPSCPPTSTTTSTSTSTSTTPTTTTTTTTTPPAGCTTTTTTTSSSTTTTTTETTTTQAAPSDGGSSTGGSPSGGGTSTGGSSSEESSTSSTSATGEAGSATVGSSSEETTPSGS